MIVELSITYPSVPKTAPTDGRPEDSFEVGMGILITIGVMVFMYLMYQRSKWLNKFTFGKLKFNNDNLLGAYVCLGALMIHTGKKEAKEKIVYTKNYLNRYFPKSEVHIDEMINHVFRNPVEINRVSSWLNQHLLHKQKLQVVYFLAGMSVIDGSMDSREIKLLRKISNLLELSPKEFDSVIAMYQQKRERNRSESSTGPKSANAKKTLIQLACKVLGVSEQSSIDEIKKAYRSLVKKHHPDRFFSESQEEQEIANERFLEIQKSYEIIEKYK